jgi:hypothetical protein
LAAVFVAVFVADLVLVRLRGVDELEPVVPPREVVLVGRSSA